MSASKQNDPAKRRPLRANTVRFQKSEDLAEGVLVEVDVSPLWWPYIHHDRNGPFAMTIVELLRKVEALDLTPVAVRAEPSSLTVVFVARSPEAVYGYMEIRRVLTEHLTGAITVEEDDYASDARPPPATDPVLRSQIMARLKECGFACLADDQSPLAYPAVSDDSDIWNHIVGVCVQFDADTKPEETGVARWIDRSGEQKLSFDRVLGRLAAFRADSAEAEPGIFPSTGEARGGVFVPKGP